MSTNGGVSPTLGQKADKPPGAPGAKAPPAEGGTLHDAISVLAQCCTELAQRVVAIERRAAGLAPASTSAQSDARERLVHDTVEAAVHRLRAELPLSLDKHYFRPAFDGLRARIFAIESRTNETHRQVAGLVKERGVGLVERLDEPSLKALAKGTVRFVQPQIDALKAELAEKTTYRGIWKAETRYRQNDETTKGGRLWHCNYETADKPGTSGAWRMKDKEDAGRR